MSKHSLLVAAFLTATLLSTNTSPAAHAATTAKKLATKAPAIALSSMKAGGISLGYQTLPIGTNGAPVGAHLYVVPAGRLIRLNSYHGGEIPKPGSPFKRSDIAPGPASLITDSPFTLDLFAPQFKGGPLKLINSVHFTESRDLNGLTVRYLEPKTKRGPMLLLGFSSLGTYDLTVATFPQGIASPASVDHFSGGGAGGGGVQVSFDGVDSHGFTTVEKKPYTKIYNDKYERFVWNGQHFALASSAPAPRNTLTLTETDNNTAVTLEKNQTLIVRLPDIASTGNVWSLVDIPGMPLRLVSQCRLSAGVNDMAGAPGIQEWKFVGTSAAFGQMTYLKLLLLRPFDAGITDARLWEVKVTLPESK